MGINRKEEKGRRKGRRGEGGGEVEEGEEERERENWEESENITTGSTKNLNVYYGWK